MMNEINPMTVLIIEDNPAECLKLAECAAGIPEVKIIGVTNSSYEGVRLAEHHLPEAIILDLELHHGSGSGIHFLNELLEDRLSNDPFLFVTTHITAESVLGMVRAAGVTWIFSKKQTDYSVEQVFDMALQLRRANGCFQHGVTHSHGETLEEKRMRIIEYIEHELDLLGISRMLKGRVYLVEGIYFLAETKFADLRPRKDTVIDYLSKLYNRNGSALTRTMQTAIRSAWQRSSIEVLMKHYTDRVNYRTGIPTTNEFLIYYAKRVRKMV